VLEKIPILFFIFMQNMKILLFPTQK